MSNRPRQNVPILGAQRRKGRTMAKKNIVSVLTRIKIGTYNDCVDKNRIRAYRERSGMNGADVARALGWKAQQWSDFESARHPNPRIGTILAVCDVLGCEVTDLLRPRLLKKHDTRAV